MAYGQTPNPPPGYGQQPPPAYSPQGRYPQLDIGKTLSDAFELYKNHFMAFFGFWAIPAILAMFINLMQPLFLGGTSTPYSGFGPTDQPDLGMIWVSLGIMLLFLVAVMIINILFTGGIIGMTKEAMVSGKTSAQAGFDTIRKYFGSILATSIVVGLITAIGFMLCCIPGIFFCYWWMFAVTIVVVEGVGLSEAMSRSKDFAVTRQTFWFAVVLILVVGLISMVASMITGAISLPLFLSLGYWPGQIVSTLIGQLFQWIIAPYATIAIAIHYIKGREQPVATPAPYAASGPQSYAPGAVPPPAAVPQPQQYTCPGCGAPIRYIKQYQRWYCDRCQKYL